MDKAMQINIHMHMHIILHCTCIKYERILDSTAKNDKNSNKNKLNSKTQHI